MTDSAPQYGVDEEALGLAAQKSQEFVDELLEKEKARESVQREADQEQDQQAAELEDPRNAETWGAKALIKEGQSILSGGLQDTASSIATFPERTVDALSGEMQRQRQETGTYRPDWTPFKSYDNPIETKTWWGKQLRGLVHFGSLAAGTILAAKGAAATGIIGLPAGLVALTKGNVARGAVVGAVSDLVSKESDEANALGALRDRYGWFDTPLSTRDTDHPVVMKIKNIVEGMGFGLFFDGLAYTLKKGGKPVVDQIIARNKNIKDQTVEAGVAQLRRGDEEFRADKNAPLAQPHQGAHVSQTDATTARRQLERTRKEWGAEEGSAGSVTTPVERERIAQYGGTDEKTVERVMRDLMTDQGFRAKMKAAKGNLKSLAERYGDAVATHQKVTVGRNAVDFSGAEYLKDVLEADRDLIDGERILKPEKVIAADLIMGTLFRQLRDTGIAAREIADIVDITDIDGPAKQIADTMLMLVYETKKARFTLSDAFRQLGAGKTRKQAIEEAVRADVEDAKESIMSILKIVKDDKDDDMLNAVIEAFSMMDDITSVEDFDNWARTVIKGGKLNAGDIDRTGALIRELEGVMTNSVLSGPKTPLRAIMGTASATFLRPLSASLGAVIRYPFTGDATTVRASLASVNAMVEAIPESFTLFKSKLNSYWKGDLASIKTRYSEFTRGDANWELLRKWAEDSGRATPGDVAAFRLANIARSLNDSNFLTYSTKIMAATDDAFAHILGRAKMREKAMRNVLDQQAAGVSTPKITPELMRAYEDDFYAQVFNPDGSISDKATQFARAEVTLTQPLTGFAKGLNDIFTATPLLKPFFLFARTGVNGLALTGKYTPGFNFLVKEFNDIALARADDLTDVIKYGIETPEDLVNAKALQTGRLAIGAGVVFMASMAWMRGDLHGDGPLDRTQRKAWIESGWQPNSLAFGPVRIGTSQFEPFGPIFDTIANIGDYSQLMGEEWTKNQLGKVSLVIAQAISSKSYMQGLQSMVDLVAGRPGQAARIVAAFANNTIPLAGLRNTIGNILVPYMREINSGIAQSVRNRNKASELLAGVNPFIRALPISYSPLNAQPVNDWDFLTRVANNVLPVTLTLTQSAGEQFFIDSGYDKSIMSFYLADGTPLTDAPVVKSAYEKNMGEQTVKFRGKTFKNLEAAFTYMSKDSRIIASVNQMNQDRRSNRGLFEPMSYYHTQAMDYVVQQARRKATAKTLLMPEAKLLAEAEREKTRLQRQKSSETRNLLKFKNV